MKNGTPAMGACDLPAKLESGSMGRSAIGFYPIGIGLGRSTGGMRGIIRHPQHIGLFLQLDPKGDGAAVWIVLNAVAHQIIQRPA